MKLFFYLQTMLYVGGALLIFTSVNMYLDTLPRLYFIVFLLIIFTISLTYLIAYYFLSLGHVESYDRIPEGVVISAIIYNPFIVFALDLAVWMFLNIVFAWIFFLYARDTQELAKKHGSATSVFSRKQKTKE